LGRLLEGTVRDLAEDFFLEFPDLTEDNDVLRFDSRDGGLNFPFLWFLILCLRRLKIAVSFALSECELLAVRLESSLPWDVFAGSESALLNPLASVLEEDD